MSRSVKDFVEIGEHTSLGDLIDRLTELRDSLPDDSDAELKIRGDDIFGRHLSIAFNRPQTVEEAALEARYADAFEVSRRRELERLQDELGLCAIPRRRALRAAA